MGELPEVKTSNRVGGRFEHFALPDAEQLERAARLRVHVAAQPVFLHSLGGNHRHYLPDAYLPRCYPSAARDQSRRRHTQPHPRTSFLNDAWEVFVNFS